MKRLSIAYYILIPVGIVLSVGIVALIFVSGMESTSMARELNSQVIMQASDPYILELESSARQALGTALAAEPSVRYFLREEGWKGAVADYFGELFASNPMIEGMWLSLDGQSLRINRQGEAEALPSNIVQEYRSAFEQYIGMGEPYYTDPFYTGESLLYSCAVPVYREEEPVGALGVDINLSGLQQRAKEEQILGEGALFIINSRSRFVTHPDDDFIDVSYRETWLREYAEQIEEVGANGSILQFRANARLLEPDYPLALGQRVLLSMQPIAFGDTNWVICSMVPEITAVRPALYATLVISLIGIIQVLLVGSAIILIVRLNLKKMPELTDSAIALSKGEISEVNLAEQNYGDTQNEVELLHKAFVEMVHSTKAQVETALKIADGDFSMEIHPKSEKDQLNVAMKEMLRQNNHVFQNILSAGDAVKAGALHHANMASTLAQTTAEQSTSIQQLSITSTQIENKAVENEELSGKAAELSEKARLRTLDSAEKMGQMADSVQEIRKANQDIASVAKLINDIAFETGILSLNAAIEAARAGVNAQGFAVVAEEVRTLAEKSTQAAEKIGTLIDVSEKKSKQSIQVVEEITRLFTDILDYVNKSYSYINQIPDATRMQVGAIQNITAEMQVLLQSIEQTSAIAQECAASGEELGGQAELLFHMIRHFRLQEDSSYETYMEPYTGKQGSFAALVAADGGDDSLESGDLTQWE